MQQVFGFSIPDVKWQPPRIADLPSWRDAKRVCVDVETKDPDLQDRPGHKGMGPGNFRPGCHTIGIAFSIEDGESHYLPIRHEGGDNLDVEQVLAYVREQAREFQGTILGANLGYDLGFLARDKISFPKVAWHRDVQHNAVLLYELHYKYSLDAICEREGIPGKDPTILNAFAEAYGVDPKVEMFKLPGRAVEAYAKQDVRLPHQLIRRQERQIEEAGLGRVVDMESRLIPMLVQMRGRGVRVDVPKVHRIILWATERAQEYLDQVRSLTGVTVRLDQVWKAAVMARPLLAAGINVPRTKGEKQFSIKNHLLETYGEVGKALSRVRAYARLLQFAEQTLSYLVGDRLHPVTHQLRVTKENSDESKDENKGGRYGRTSMEDPNTQQQPVRDDEFGEMWRSVYIPDEGCFWVCSDWSQQEPRIAVHYAEKLGLPGAREFADKYRNDPTTDCHMMLTRMIGFPEDRRKIVKNWFNGCVYGMGDTKLCIAIGKPTVMVQRYGKILEVPGPEGQAIIDVFRNKLPWVGLLVKHAARRAEEKGVVWTIDGRRCNFPRKLDGSGYDWTHKAFSRIGQGGAAGQMKLTYIEAINAGIPIQLIVHDEFDFSCRDIKQAKLLMELQRDTVKFSVPMLVDSEIGRNWGSCKKVSKLEADGELDAYVEELLREAA